MIRRLSLAPIFLVLALVSPVPALAQKVMPPSVDALSETAPDVAALFKVIGLYDVLDIMSAEGIAAGPGMEEDLFSGRGGSAWAAVVASIYASDRLIDRFEAAVPLDRLSAEHLATLSEFFASDLGARIAAGEVAARRAFLDPEIEAAATELAQTRAAERHPRMAQLTEFIAVNDLVDRNVSGALNSNFAFYRALSEGGAFAAKIPEEAMLAEVWGQEAEIRADTLDWLFAYQTLAYEDLSDADMQAYIALSQSPAGQALNAALFAAFDDVFEGISADLGRAAAGFVAGEDT